MGYISSLPYTLDTLYMLNFAVQHISSEIKNKRGADIQSPGTIVQISHNCAISQPLYPLGYGPSLGMR